MTVLFIVCAAFGAFSVYMIIENSDLHTQIDEKTGKIERLLDDVTNLAAQLQKRDDKGRFKKK